MGKHLMFELQVKVVSSCREKVCAERQMETAHSWHRKSERFPPPSTSSGMAQLLTVNPLDQKGMSWRPIYVSICPYRGLCRVRTELGRLKYSLLSPRSEVRERTCLSPPPLCSSHERRRAPRVCGRFVRSVSITGMRIESRRVWWVSPDEFYVLDP